MNNLAGWKKLPNKMLDIASTKLMHLFDVIHVESRQPHINPTL